MKSITFDKKNPNWNNNEQYNLLFIRNIEMYLTGFLKTYGYVYDHQICAAFCIGWNPKNVDRVHLYDDELTFRQVVGWFETFCQKDGSIIINILDVEKGP